MRIAPRVMCLLVIAVVVYGLVYMSFIRQERNNDNRLQRPEDLEVLRRLKRIEVLVYKIGEFLLIAYITTHYFFIISTLACFHFSAKVIEVKNQKVKKAVVEQKITKKLHPKSPLFSSWGDELTEEEQMEAERKFQEFGYNVFLSNRLPLNRTIPDTRDIR